MLVEDILISNLVIFSYKLVEKINNDISQLSSEKKIVVNDIDKLVDKCWHISSHHEYSTEAKATRGGHKARVSNT